MDKEKPRKPSKAVELRLRHNDVMQDAVQTWGHPPEFRHFRYTRYRRHQYLQYRITLAFVILDGTLHCALSACSPKDQFNKRLGRAQATERLLLTPWNIRLPELVLHSDMWQFLVADLYFWMWDQEEKQTYACRSIMADAPATAEPTSQEPESD